MFVSECTDGKFLPLSNAELLPKVIVGSVKQALAIEALEERLDEEMDKIAEEFKEKEGRDPSEEEVDEILTAKFQAAGMEIDEIDLDSMYTNKPPRENIDLLLNDQECPTLKDFQAKAKRFPRLKYEDMAFLPEKVDWKPTPTPSRPMPTPCGGGPPMPTKEMEAESWAYSLSSEKKKRPHFDPMFLSERVDDCMDEVVMSGEAEKSGFTSFAYAPSSATSSTSMSAASAPPRKQEMRMKKAPISLERVSMAKSRVVRKRAKRGL
jgi:hypothetical protein